jgi:hypothetical protein
VPLDLDAFLDKTYGYPEPTWEAARQWLTARLRRVAASGHGETVSYSDLCDEMRKRDVIDLEPHGTPLAALLGQVNVIEHEHGNPLISAVVVGKDTMQPGVGFWNIAKDLGIQFGDSPNEREAFWLQSLEECHKRWKPNM